VPNEMLVNPALSTLSAPGTSGPVTVGASTTVNGTLTISGDVYSPGGNLSTALDVVAGGNYRFGSSSSAEMLYRTAPGQVRLTATLSADGLSSGGTALLGRDPSAPLEAATKQYADTKLTQAQGDARYVTTASGGLTQSAADVRYLQLAGGQMAGTLFSQRIEILSGMRLTLSGQPGDAFLSNDGTGLKFNYYGQDAIKIIDSAVVPMASYIDVGASANRFASVWTRLLNVDGNIVVNGLTRRIQGDFSNATPTSLTMLQSSTLNGVTSVRAIPNGTSQIAEFGVLNNSNPSNASILAMTVTGTASYIQSVIVGGGTYLPMAFLAGGAERLRILTSGKVQWSSTDQNPPYIYTPRPDSLGVEAPGAYLMLMSKVGTHMGGNTYWDGVNWMRYDTASPSSFIVAAGGNITMYNGGAGANPLTYGVSFLMDNNGLATIYNRIRHNTDSGWSALAYSPGWSSYGDGNYGANVGYRKLATGQVIMRGLVQGGAANTQVATLPPGFRPANIHLFAQPMYGGVQRVDVASDGGIRCAEMLAGTFSNLWLSLAGITFLAEA